MAKQAKISASRTYLTAVTRRAKAMALACLLLVLDIFVVALKLFDELRAVAVFLWLPAKSVV